MSNQNHSLNIAFIGLGVMGFPMAGYLANAGHKVTVYNRTDSKAELWLKEYKGAKAATPAEAAKGKDVVFACVGNDDDLREVTVGDKGAFNTMKEGSIFVDHTTTSALVAQELAQIAQSKNIGYADAPVSGGQAGAQSGALTVMVGAEPRDYQKIESLIRCYAKMQKLLGPVGSGQMAKMVNQICIAGVVQGLSEALHFAKQNGLDAEAVVEVISKGAAQSWQMDNRASTMLDNEFNFGFAVDWMRKDLGIVLDQARVSKAHLPLTALVDQFYSQVQANGGGRFDTSSLITLLEKK
ncbi:NAD(P)-dependent oxidoreductase [Aliiglaciecola sp. 2_MG-2023]|uniref:NAD(P)-dependent oxidoreductase n=1 Tax=Alteromonadaceae TaxID=72275 RepID=UPI0026E25FB7|nr:MULTISPECIES: NAD(P)-dependent oxidoreductase [unclassified Aliiglaciecola]MDO6711855.1 NAD(P)-dependent oxidoreductase [Aliiglaciecola sp. 2_MG-2023]MDO6752971.1 NAD(P)-dependent oxidoreductase [Aliiglaciecola sp. 1_MG-2023]